MAAAPADGGRGGVSLCFATASGVKALALSAFTLAWTHSVAKVEWQEDWRVTPAGLELVQARVKGTGPGMEPPPEARLVDGWFQWRPQRPPMHEVVLGNSGSFISISFFIANCLWGFTDYSLWHFNLHERVCFTVRI
jgi:hypothetical protein